MDYTAHINHLRHLVRDVQAYYIRANHAQLGSDFSLPRPMIAFMLSAFPAKEGERVLELLLEEGCIQSMDASSITFSEAFLKRQKALDAFAL